GLGARQLLQELRIGSIGACVCEFAEHARETVVARGVPVAAGTVAECTREIALARARRAADQHHFVGLYPCTRSEAQDDALVEPAWTTEVDVFERGGQMQLRQLQQAREAPVLARGV